MIIFLMSNVHTRKDIYHLNMEAHSRYVTEAHPNISPKFNKRFALSLT
ncbi:hypothetical protein X975_18484, partial [Stegodyphus mimosarum]